ncbi:bile acid:sodium symporter family protein [Nevskia soli]|uniref:bile acid:sodium symporter family protein n=1 Tax=Nevskia soli TaxID=418856 RepID=UPI00068E7EDD|nr:bile acid:sodium symporter family protein [Nevskia soli]
MTRSISIPGVDRFTLALVATVTAATLLPARGEMAAFFDDATVFAVALLFFLHGAKLSRQAIVAGASHWRLHLTVVASTFALFPLLGIALKPLLSPLVTPELYLGVLFVCALPATVQSAIAFTSIARGNVPAAICSASASSFIGIFLTPLLAGILIGTHAATGGSDTLDAIGKIVVQLLLPFIAGQVARSWIGAWVDRNHGMLRFVDQGSILLVVYAAFSAAVLQGLWHQVPPRALGGLLVVNGILLTLVLLATRYAARLQGFDRADEITTVFCGSKKSLASGVPMAKVLFAGHAVGVIVLPLMLFHQMQLMVCAVLARKYAERRELRLDAVPGSVAPATDDYRRSPPSTSSTRPLK